MKPNAGWTESPDINSQLRNLVRHVAQDNLLQKPPSVACEDFTDEQLKKNAPQTYRKRSSVANRFTEFLATTEDVQSISQVQKRHFKEFEEKHREKGNEEISLNGMMSCLRVYMIFCEEKQYVEKGMHEDVPVPEVDNEDEISTGMPSDRLIFSVANTLKNSEYGSRRHVEFELMRKNQLRVATIRAIDEDDHDYQDGSIKLRHRPEEDKEVEGTRLKNKKNSNRNISIDEELNEIIQTYKENDEVREKYDNITDKYDRTPLLTSEHHGEPRRPSVGTIRRDLYKITRPCKTGLDCPQDRDPSACEAETNSNASKCPDNVSPHPVRVWAITTKLTEGVPEDVISGSADVSIKVLRKHYDRRDEEELRKQRLDILEEELPHDYVTESEEPQQSDSDELPESPATLLLGPIDVPKPIGWLCEDLKQAVAGSGQPPAKVATFVGIHLLATVLVYTLPILI